MFIKSTQGFVYIDKLWVKNKGKGVGTKCFGEYLEQSTKPIIWRTRTQRLKDWYLSFKGVRTIGKYEGYHYFKYSHADDSLHAWTYEDMVLFHEPSLTGL
jgi:hypothetical protein